MAFSPIEKMRERVEVARQDSDTALFDALMLFGEMTLKTAAAGMVASILDDKNRNRYRHLYKLVRADGIGEWSVALEDVLTGPASQYLTPHARVEQRQLTLRTGSGQWQYDAGVLVHKALKVLDASREDFPTKADARRWFAGFVELRNKTRGHGAVQGALHSRLAPLVEQSINLICDNFALFNRPWAYVQRNLSGKYRVTVIGSDSPRFEVLKSARNVQLTNGLYLHLDDLRLVELIISDIDATDFFFPNGGFNAKRFEVLSYITGQLQHLSANPYLSPATELPPSETEGIGILIPQGQAFGNLPPSPTGYITRTELEKELREALDEQRHAIVTLVGRGGIGKTSTALTVLHAIADDRRFGAIIWFSARDIDLLPEGAKLVQPQVLSHDDISEEFVRLMQPGEAQEKGFKPSSYLASALGKSPIGEPILFVFDNFETVRNPAELYTWIDTYIRVPNKVLITTRYRDFKADFPVEVFGMTEPEADQLVLSTAATLGIRKLLTTKYREQLYRESDGHPYVLRILLGEVAKAGRLVQIPRIVAEKSDILNALFERTYTALSPAAKLVFLTLCNWRSIVPQVAIEAVMWRTSVEKTEVEEAIEELRRSSFIEVSRAADKSEYISVPLVAAVFGKRKLAVSPMKGSVESNTELLRYLGATQKFDMRGGLGPRIEKMFLGIAAKIRADDKLWNEYLPMLEFIAQKYPPAWLMLATLFEESGREDAIERAKEAVRRYLETTLQPEQQRPAWEKLVDLCARTDDYEGELHARVELAQLSQTPFRLISNSANRINKIFAERQFLSTIGFDVLIRRLADVMVRRIAEGDATDCSRLAWLLLHLQDVDGAREYVDLGLHLDYENEHCTNLKAHLDRQSPA